MFDAWSNKSTFWIIMTVTLSMDNSAEIVRNDLILSMTPGNRSKAFQNWSKARFASHPKKLLNHMDTSREEEREINQLVTDKTKMMRLPL